VLLRLLYAHSKAFCTKCLDTTGVTGGIEVQLELSPGLFDLLFDVDGEKEFITYLAQGGNATDLLTARVAVLEKTIGKTSTPKKPWARQRCNRC
jgi:hypothetical protein